LIGAGRNGRLLKAESQEFWKATLAVSAKQRAFMGCDPLEINRSDRSCNSAFSLELLSFTIEGQFYLIHRGKDGNTNLKRRTSCRTGQAVAS
jgi:hypothetical protein